MIAHLQKARYVTAQLLRQLREGRPPSVLQALEAGQEELADRPFGSPLTRFRPARPGLPIGGRDGQEVAQTFREIREDLETLYTGTWQLLQGTAGQYDLFAIRRDRLALKLSQYRDQVQSLLNQVGAGSKFSASDSFNTLEHVDLDRTTALVELSEGLVTLPIDSRNSVAYDARGAILLRETVDGQPVAGVSPLTPAFTQVFSPYRVDAWYMNLPAGSTYVAEVNVTGADYGAGAEAEIALNALQIEVVTPLHLEVTWSPDGYNWHPLDAPINEVVTDRRTFHFQTVPVGYLRFTLTHAPGTGGTAPVLGIKRVALLQRGFSTSAAFYSEAWTFPRRVHHLQVESEQSVPLGTSLRLSVAQGPDGPWIPVLPGPMALGELVWEERELTTWTPETTGGPSQFYRAPLSLTAAPLPETGELQAGVGQLHAAAFPYDWLTHQDRGHLPSREDWLPPRGAVREGVFGVHQETGVGTEGDYFALARSPFAYTREGGETYLTVALLQDDTWILQPGYNYRFRVYLYSPTPTSLTGQRVGVVNLGGATDTVLAPCAVYLNGTSVYQTDQVVASLPALSGSAHQTSLALEAGWNELELYLQLPSDLESLRTQAGGPLGTALYLYLQPFPFAPDLAHVHGITQTRAYREPWTRTAEFDLRYNVQPGLRTRWSWLLSRDEVDAGRVVGVLLNHDPTNQRDTAPLVTLDGVNAGESVVLQLRYAADNLDGVGTAGTTLYLRADLEREETAPAPPILHSYRFLVD